jgi:hypothetical protein
MLRLLFLARFPVFLGLLLPGLVPLALWGQPDLLRGLLVLDRPLHLYHITWAALLVATLVLVAFRIIEINAPARFDVPLARGATRGPWRSRWLFWLGIGLTVPVAAAVQTTADPSLEYWPADPGRTRLVAVGMVLLGLVTALGVLVLMTALQQLLVHPATAADHLLPFESWRLFGPLKAARVNWLYGAGQFLAGVLSYLGPGYARDVHDPQTGRTIRLLAPGHTQALLWFGAALIAYFVGYGLTFQRGVPDETSAFPALFYALMLMILFGALLAGLAFGLDYYRVPVLAVGLGLAILSYAVHGIDHFYDLNPPGGENTPLADVELTAVADRWQLPRVVPQTGPQTGAGTRTLVVVTAAGGGIQAAAWTTQVLAGLDARYGQNFTRSVRLISAVSGGSVGTMYYLTGGRWNGAGAPFDEDARQHMQRAARASGLEATGWGIAYPDLLRIVFPLAIPSPIVDRGWAMEQVWGRWPSVLDGQPVGNVRLRDWVEPTQAGRLPVVAFNATLVETGQRFVISPVRGPQGPELATDARQLFQLYANRDANPRVTTAVRLSATFPYVSPISRPYRRADDDPGTDYHVADGGYADNEGMTTVIDWISQLLLHYSTPGPHAARPFDRILVIRISPFPIATPNPAKVNRGWAYELIGPAETVANVRTASQAERNRVALDLLTHVAETLAPPPGQQPARQNLDLLTRRDVARARARRQRALAGIELDRSLNPTEKAAPARRQGHQALVREAEQGEQEASRLTRELVERAEIAWTTFVYEGDPPPLSWKLTQRQKAALDAAWEKIKKGDSLHIPNGLRETPLETLDRFFRRVGP